MKRIVLAGWLAGIAVFDSARRRAPRGRGPAVDIAP